MATPLTKNLLRESLDKFDGREIMVTLREDQKIALKLKGMKSGEVTIGILDLYKDLANVDTPEVESAPATKSPVSIITTPKKGSKGGHLIDATEFLNNLRSMNAISMLDIETMTKFDGIIKDAMEITEKKLKNE